jgi:dihydroorotase
MASAAPQGTQWTIRLPDDFHHHVRDGPKTAAVLTFASQRFGRCLAMPNTRPPIVTTEMAIQYKQHILESLPEGSRLEPVMTLYLTDNTAPEEIIKAHKHFGKYVACKYYPAGATTNSDSGVTDVKNLYPVLEEMQKVG